MKRFFCVLLTICFLYNPIGVLAASQEEVDAVIASIPVQGWPQAPEKSDRSHVVL